MSSFGQYFLFNGLVSHLTADYCPVLGKSSKFSNLIYNFGVTNMVFDNSNFQNNYKDEIDGKIYKYGEKCYKYSLKPDKCDKTKRIIEVSNKQGFAGMAI